MSYIDDLNAWYVSQCNDDWEHGNGITISTIDNPGWGVDVSLDFEDDDHPDAVLIHRWNSARDFLDIKISKNVFQGYGDPGKLEEIIRIFLQLFGDK